jgi:peptidoglycan/LPS O-acetylase OafA/YrhL
MPLLNSTGLFAVQKYYTARINALDYGSLTLFMLFLSNFAVRYFKPVAGAAQSWSVSVEEQFYLIWPNIVKYIKSIKHLMVLIVILLIIKVWGVQFIVSRYGTNLFLHGVEVISIEYMFVGALAAIFLFWDKTKEITLKIMGNSYLFALTVIALGLELYFFKIPMLLAFTFAALILHVSIKKIEIKFLKYLEYYFLFIKIIFGYSG